MSNAGLASDDSAVAQENSWDVIVIGAGAAGLIAAARAAERGRRTLLLEKNRHAGVKILMSGGTRCNLTHNTDKRGIVQAYGEQGPFLHSALAALTPADLVKLVEDEGVPTKIEETGKIFPRSDKASDIVDALVRRLDRSGATIEYRAAVTRIARLPNGFEIASPEKTWRAANVIVTTGGKSYPGCGTSGDGYQWLADLGHTIVPTRPALTPITTDLQWVRDLQGITLPDVLVRVVANDIREGEAPAEPSDRSAQRTDSPQRLGRSLALPKRPKKDPRAERRSSLLFTHFGLSGPAALDVSRVISGHPNPRSLTLSVDLCPDQNPEQLSEQLRREVAADGKRQVLLALPHHLPKRVLETVLEIAGVPPNQRCGELAKVARQKIVETLKQLRIAVSGTMGFRKAEVTAGGVALNEVDSRTMQSKLVPGLFLAGEILDLDGPIGGFNFQAAFSTGVLAGESA